MQRLLDEIRADPSRKKLVLMPVSRIVFNDPFFIGAYHFFPAGSVNIHSLRPIPNKTLEGQMHTSGIVTTLQGQTLREVKSSLTGFCVDTLASNPLVAFIEEFDWDKFLDATHEEDISLLKKLSAKVERALDMMRFNHCSFDLPDTLPGLAGSWDGSGQYLGALLHTSDDHESYLVAGAAVECSIVVRGLGLEIDPCVPMLLPEPSDGEVAANLLHGLSLYSDAMSTSNETMKFIRIFTLLDFLADPDSSRSWEKQKGNIICHRAKDTASYHKLSERFKELTELRTQVVHRGKFLPELLLEQRVRNQLFRELQQYASCVLHDMIHHFSMSWDKYCEHRNILKKTLTSMETNK